MKCPKCRFENPPGMKFCGECGHALSTPEGPVAIDFRQPQSYTPKHLIDKILTSRSAIEGERKLVTIMFADVAGFTPMSEKLDPEDVYQSMLGTNHTRHLVGPASCRSCCISFLLIRMYCGITPASGILRVRDEDGPVRCRSY